MQEIENKIRELLEVSKPFDWKGSTDRITAFDERMHKQETLMNELTALARAHNTIIGRTISFSVADGRAVYLITKVNKRTVALQWIDWMDGYSEELLGEGKASLSIDKAMQKINFDDYWESLREENKRKNALPKEIQQ